MYSVDRIFSDQAFLSLCHRCHVAALFVLHKVNSNSNNCLFSELPSASVGVRCTRAVAAPHPTEFDVLDVLELWLRLIQQSLKYQSEERPNLQGASCRPRLVCGLTFPTLCLTLER